MQQLSRAVVLQDPSGGPGLIRHADPKKMVAMSCQAAKHLELGQLGQLWLVEAMFSIAPAGCGLTRT